LKSLILLCLLVTSAYSQETIPDTRIVKDPLGGYATMDQAAKAGLAVAETKTKERHVEYGGGIQEINGHFYYTEPVTINSPISIKFNIRGALAAETVAIYHTHPVAIFIKYPTDTARFSPQDMMMALGHNVPSYIWSEGDNTVRVFNSKSAIIREPGEYPYSLGTIL
jgi:hypothetical protein